MVEHTSNKTMAKNTILLYFRMMVTMCVSLYTSRVILKILGVDDYGIYQAVGGIVGFMSFMNSALATGSSRFLTFELGVGDEKNLRKTFSTTLLIHIGLALFVIFLGETVGLWFFYNKMVIPEERFASALWCFHLSVAAAAVTITQVPYNASIISHEKMGIFAYVSIVDAFLKLMIVYLLTIGHADKLVLYAVLLLMVNVSIQLFYRWYCTHNFEETHFSLNYDRDVLRKIAAFSGWSLFSNASIALNSQGILLLLNMFFSPAVVAARAVSLQVNGVVNQFVNSFRSAVNPQIVKRWAQKDFDGSRSLLLSSVKYSFYLVYLLGGPIILSADKLLNLWLGVVPEYTVVFLQLIIIQNFFGVLDLSFYQALYAKGQIKENALISPIVGFLRFPITYVLFINGFSPVYFSILCVISYFILGCFIKPILLVKIAGYKYSDFVNLFETIFKVVGLSMPLPLFMYFKYGGSFSCEILSVCFCSFIFWFSSLIVIYFFGLDSGTRNTVNKFIYNKFKNK